MQKVKLLKAAGPYRKGQIVEVDPQRAEQWIADGVVEAPKEKN